jgi:hypothetical protein
MILKGADVDDAVFDPGEVATTLIPLGGVSVVASVDGGTAGQESHRLRRAAIVLKRAEHWVDVQQIGGAPARHVLGVPDQIVPLRAEVPVDIRASGRRCVAGNNRVPHAHRTWTGIDATPFKTGRV